MANGINYNESNKILNLSDNQKREYAYRYAEGNEYLYNLLLNLWNNGIYTLGCCGGHIEKNEPYTYFSYMLTSMEANALSAYIIELVDKYKDLDLKCFILGPHPKTKFLDFSFKFPIEYSEMIISEIISFLNNIDYRKKSDDLLCAYNILNNNAACYFIIEMNGGDNKSITYVNNGIRMVKQPYIDEIFNNVMQEIESVKLK